MALQLWPVMAVRFVGRLLLVNDYFVDPQKRAPRWCFGFGGVFRLSVLSFRLMWSWVDVGFCVLLVC